MIENNILDSASIKLDAGDRLYGFKVLSRNNNTSTKCNEIKLMHEKTGAIMIILKNNDKDRGFCIGFNTPCENDKGINHILEHCILGGSKKYPANNLSFNVMNNTYASFVNGITYQKATVFPVCSQNEEQLLKLIDIYMDSVYNPLILKDEKIFRREGWRYEMESSDSPLTVNGIAYNEMKGYYGSIEFAADQNDKKTLFKGTNQSFDMGGVPDCILDLTYDEILKFYNKNYNPSNSFMILYGDIDCTKYLKLINDNYLSRYEKKEIVAVKQVQNNFNDFIEKSYLYPVAENSKNIKSIIDVAFAIKDIRTIQKEDYCALSILSKLLMDATSYFMRALKDSGIGEDYSIIFRSLFGYKPSFIIRAKNADPSKSKDFYNLVIKHLNIAYSHKVNREYAVSLIKSLRFSYSLAGEKGSTFSLLNAAKMYMTFDDPTIDFISNYRKLQHNIKDGYLEDTIKRYLLDNKKCALIKTIPKSGLLEENMTKLKDKLAAKKESMNKVEIDKIVTMTKELKEWNSNDINQCIINSMKAVTAKEIQLELKKYNITETQKKGIKIVNVDAAVNDIGFLNLNFNLSHLSKEELHYIEFYCDLVNNHIPTETRNIDDITNILTSNTHEFNISVDVNNDDEPGNKAHPVVSLSSYIMTEDIQFDLILFNDVILNSILDDKSDGYIKDSINHAKQKFNSICSSPMQYMSIRSAAYMNLSARYRNYYTGIDYDNFIQELETSYQRDSKSVIQKLREVRDKAFTKNNLTVLFAGNKQAQNTLYKYITLLTRDFNNTSYRKISVELPIPFRREAITTNSSVQAVYVNSNLMKAGEEEHGKLNVIAKLLKERLLLPQIRLNGGAYNVGCYFKDGIFTAYTGRDKNFLNSMKVISRSREYMKDVLSILTQEILDNYIVSTFAAKDKYHGELTGAVEALSDYTNSRSSDYKMKTLEQIKSTDLNSLKSSPELLDKLNKNVNYIVSALPDIIEAHKDLFDNIINLQ